MWYYLVRTEDPTIELAWSFEQRANAGELVVGGWPAIPGWWYLSGIYFTVVSLVSCSSPMLPHSATEMTLSLFLHVFGWVFGSLLISTLAAWLVDTKALQCISPALLKSLAFAVHRKAHVRPLAVDLAVWMC
jgi:hypothetical protein